MSRKSKKGFQKLESQEELADFTNLRRDSDSDLDLRDDTHDVVYGSCGCSCCWWFLGLYLIILTSLVLLMGVCMAYIAVNFIQFQGGTSDDHAAMYKKIEDVRSQLDDANKSWTNHYLAAGETMLAVNKSLSHGLSSLDSRVQDLEARVGDLDQRVSDIESKPQEMLIRELEQKLAAMNQSMSYLKQMAGPLNQSLRDVKDMKSGMATFKSQIESYDSQLRDINRGFGDLKQEKTDLEVKVDGVKIDVTNVKAKVKELQDSMATSHSQLQQSVDLVSNQFTNLQVIASTMNDSVREEVELIWTNLTQQESQVEDLAMSVSTLREDVDALTEKVAAEPPDKATDMPPHNSTTPQATVAPEATTDTATAEPTIEPTHNTSTEPTEEPTHSGTTEPTHNGTTEQTIIEPSHNATTTEVSKNTTEQLMPTPPPANYTQPAINTTDVLTELPSEGSPTTGTTLTEDNTHDSTEATEDFPDKQNAAATDEEPTTNSTAAPLDSTSATEDNPSQHNQTVLVTDSTPPQLHSNSTGVNSTTNTETVTQDTIPPSEAPKEDSTTEPESSEKSNAVAILESLLDQFIFYDKDDDGALSVYEFSQKFPYSHAENVFKMLDQDPIDGSLSPEEIQTAIDGLKEDDSDTGSANGRQAQ